MADGLLLTSGLNYLLALTHLQLHCVRRTVATVIAGAYRVHFGTTGVVLTVDRAEAPPGAAIVHGDAARVV